MKQDKLVIFDTTLRDGEQSPGIALTPHEKLIIAQQLEKLKVDVIEAGFAASSPGDWEGVNLIANSVKGSTIASLARCVQDDIDQAWEAIKPATKSRIHVFTSTSAIHMEHMLRKTPEEVIKDARESVKLATKYCEDVEFSAQDATRTDHDFLIEILKVAVEEGATTINVPDTVGYATPSDYKALLERVYTEVRGNNEDVIISTHCHNDLGLAVANSLTAIEAGARQIEGAINGIGERAGNTSTEEIIMAVKTRQDQFGVEINAETTEIFETSRIVSKFTGYPVQYNKAVVGKNAFSHESGIHQHGYLRKKETYEIMSPDSVGQGEAKIILGKHSGRAGFKDALDKLEYVLSEDEFNDAFDDFKKIADRKGEIVENELRAILGQTTPSQNATKLVSISVNSEDDHASAKITLNVDGKEIESEATGDGMIDAAFTAVKQILKSEAKLIDYRVESITTGSDATAEIITIVNDGHLMKQGRSVSTDVVQGSVLAFLDALNKQ
ncbi:MAG: 2-isopropylmalate synthase [Actinomycetota bacterium]|nr:2-isopropylmalate synthase [Actinomycetota bacterium]|tara:strand:+ start:176 stop:1672 length:1497 start_codon:yes stop_codon:yes gene_type:complete